MNPPAITPPGLPPSSPLPTGITTHPVQPLQSRAPALRLVGVMALATVAAWPFVGGVSAWGLGWGLALGLGAMLAEPREAARQHDLGAAAWAAVPVLLWLLPPLLWLWQPAPSFAEWLRDLGTCWAVLGAVTAPLALWQGRRAAAAASSQR